MEIRQLDYFVAVANERSFTLAAKRLFVVQSAVSAAIAALERDLGVVLFERNAQRVVLTEAGAAFLPEALTVLDAVQTARGVVEDLGTGVRGTVRVGTLAGFDLVDVAALAGDFRRRHPGVDLKIQLSPSGSSGVAAAVRAGDLDVGFFVAVDPPHRELSTRELVRVPQVLAVPEAHRLAGVRTASIADLAGEDFVDFPVGYGNRTLTDRAFAAAGVERHVAIEVYGPDSATNFVRHGIGVSILPLYAARGEGVRIVPIEHETFELAPHVATLRRRRPTTAVRALLGLVDEHVQRLEGTLPGRHQHQ
jgi:DNA-binding transcriptional LysR family regulator